MISEGLKSNSTLTTLDLSSDEKKKVKWKEEKREIQSKNWIENKIGDSGAKMICEGLKSNSTLTKLDLGCDEKGTKI